MFFSVVLFIPFLSWRWSLGHNGVAWLGRAAFSSGENTGRMTWLTSGSHWLPSLNEQVPFAAGFPVCCLQFQSRTKLKLCIWIHSQLLIHCFSNVSPYDLFFLGWCPCSLPDFQACGCTGHRAIYTEKTSLNHFVARFLPLLKSLIFNASLVVFISYECLCPYPGLWQEVAEDLEK